MRFHLLLAAILASVITVSAIAQAPAVETMSADAALRAAREVFDRLDATGRTMTEAEANRLRECVDIIRAEQPDNPWPKYLQGRVLAMTGRHFDAIAQLREFLETREGRNDWKAHRVLGDLFVNEYPQLAKAQYQQAEQLKPGEPAVLFGLSVSAYKLGNVSEATDLARRAADADQSKTLRLLRHLVLMLSANGEWPEATQAAVKALNIARKQAESAPGREASWQAVDRQYQLVIDTFQKRLSDSPGKDEEYLELVEYIRLRADNVKRLAAFDVVAVLKMGVEDTAPDTSPALREKYAVALAEAGRRKEALEQFEKVLVDNPASVTATDWLPRLRAAEDETTSGQAP
jgi:tetratricopeptide (TPR) repeat protein